MLNWEKPELEMIRAEWPEGTSPKVKGIFTCRTGGVSSGPWGGPEGIMGLNVGPHVGDADAHEPHDCGTARSLGPEVALAGARRRGRPRR